MQQHSFFKNGLLYCLFFITSINLYGQNIKLIVIKNCVPCHNKDENPGVIFNTLKDLKIFSNTAIHLLENGIMPKTNSDAEYKAFKNEIYITEEEKLVLLKFLKENISKDILKQKLNDKTKTINTKSLSFKTKIIIPNNGVDNYICIKIPYKNKTSNIINGFSIKSSNVKYFHHIGLFILKKDELNQNMNYGINKLSYSSLSDSLTLDSLSKVYHLMKLIPRNEKYFWDWMVYKAEWQIGNVNYIFPENTGFILPKEGAILLNNIHLRPNNVTKEATLSINFNISSIPVKDVKYLYTVDIANTPNAYLYPPLYILPEKIQTHELRTQLPDDMLLYSVSPHMHYLGKSFISFAVTPNGDTINLIKINNWDPDWMKTYEFNEPIFLKKNTIIYCIATYDNTSNNSRNPNKPPRIVKEAMGFRDEMLNMIINFTAEKNKTTN